MSRTYRWAASPGCGSPTSLRAEFGNSLLGEVGAFFGFLQLLLCLAEFGQVQCGDLFSLFDLPLVGLDLLLQLVDEILHALVVLAVLLGLEAQFLDAALGFPQVLLGVGVSPLFAVQLVLQLPHALFEFLDEFLASFEGVSLGFVETDLQVLDLGLEGFAELLLGLGVVLLGAELVGEASGIDHGLLGLLLGVLGLVEELVEVGVEGLEFGLEFPLGGGERRVLGSQVVELFVSIAEFLFGLAAGAVGLFEKSAALFELVLEGVGATFGDAELFAGFVTGALFLLEGGLGVLELLLVAFDGLLGLSVSLNKNHDH